MSIFYRGAFHLVFFITKIGDDKKHKKNPRVEGVKKSIIRYIDDDREEHLLDFLWPEDNKRRAPLIFDVHGGAWMYGDRELNLDFGKYLAKVGYNVALPSYRLAFKATIKEMIQDLFHALNFLLDHADELNIDTDNIFLIGDSAGGQLILLMSAISASEELREIYQIPRPVDIRAIVTCNPAPYLHDLVFLDKPKFMNKGAKRVFYKMLFGRKFESEETYKFSSFDEFIRGIDEFPDTLITTSTGDTFVGDQARKLDEQMTSLSLEHELFTLEDETFPHVYNITCPQEERSLVVNEKILRFIERHILRNSATEEN